MNPRRALPDPANLEGVDRMRRLIMIAMATIVKAWAHLPSCSVLVVGVTGALPFHRIG